MAPFRIKVGGGRIDFVVRLGALLPLLLAGLGCTASTVTASDAGAGGTGGSGNGGTGTGTGGAGGTGTGGAGACTVTHRPVETACGADAMPTPVSCQSSADCATDGSSGLAAQYCKLISGVQQCTYDACFADSDCPDAADVCVCQGQSFGYAHASYGNVCLPGTCHQDSDCGGEMCSPSIGSGGPFYGVQGYYCHKAQDQCHCDSDCTWLAPNGYCFYNPEVAAWACGDSFAAG
jgi:hypothetical protein